MLVLENIKSPRGDYQTDTSETVKTIVGYFPGRARWADSVSLQMNTTASRDQFNPIRIGENLVVNYKDY